MEVVEQFYVLRNDIINMSGGVSEDVHIHVLVETRSDDEILRISSKKWQSAVKW